MSDPDRRKHRWLESMANGTLGGRVANASPIALRSPVRGAIAGASSSSAAAGRLWMHDVFDGDGALTGFVLSHVPVDRGAFVFLDRTPQLEGVDYTLDYSTGTITFTTAPAVGTTVSARYEYYAIPQVPPTPPAVLDVTTTNGTSWVSGSALTLASTVDAGNTLVGFVAVSGDEAGIGSLDGISGCGATWTVIEIGATTYGHAYLLVGENCTAGDTLTITSTHVSFGYSFVFQRLTSGTLNSHVLASGASGVPPRTGSVSLTAGQMALGFWTGINADGNAITEADSPSSWTAVLGTDPPSLTDGLAYVIFPAWYAAAGTAEHVASSNATNNWWGAALILDPS